jgi:excisionase family DNA binding protein
MARVSRRTRAHRAVGGSVTAQAAVDELGPLDERLLKPGEVASLFRVDTKTLRGWANAGKITAVRTRGGHRRYRESEVRALLGKDQGAARKENEHQ